MTNTRIEVGPSESISDKKAISVAIRWQGEDATAIVFRWKDTVVAYVNQCQHVSYPLDHGLDAGDVFSPSGEQLACPVHGALYDPATGNCTAGPCRGQALDVIPTTVENGIVFIDVKLAEENKAAK